MPKIGITGHTSGVGKHLFDQMGHKGWSLSTGTDLSTDEGIDKMIAEASDVDVLINNAENGENIKLKVMKKVWEKWRWEDKILVNKVNLDENQDLALKYSIRSIPSLLLFEGGSLLDMKVGMLSKTDLLSWIESKVSK